MREPVVVQSVVRGDSSYRGKPPQLTHREGRATLFVLLTRDFLFSIASFRLTRETADDADGRGFGFSYLIRADQQRKLSLSLNGAKNSIDDLSVAWLEWTADTREAS